MRSPLRAMTTSLSSLFVLLCLTTMLSATASGDPQVVARQAEPDEYQQEFDSPMVLEIPVPWIPDLSRGYGRNLGADVKDFVCDDASLVELIVERERDRGSGAKAYAQIDVEGTLFVRESYDRLVDLELTLMKGETKVASDKIRGIDAEEGYKTPFKSRLEVPLRHFDGWDESAPILKIVMAVRGND